MGEEEEEPATHGPQWLPEQTEQMPDGGKKQLRVSE